MSAELNTHEIIDVRNAVLDAGVWRVGEEFTFASGEQANNKLEMDRLFLPENYRQLEKVTAALAKIAVGANPDLLCGVPSGGQDLAVIVGQILRVPVISIDKNEALIPGEKNFHYTLEKDQQMVAAASRAVLIEDVTTSITSIGGVLKLDGLAEKTCRIVAVWRRGKPSEERLLPLPPGSLHWIIQQSIPNQITKKYHFYELYGHQAIGELPQDLET